MEIVASLILPATAACFFYTAQIKKPSGPYIPFEDQETLVTYPRDNSTPNVTIEERIDKFSNQQKYEIIKSFSNNVIETSIDIEPDIVNFVNDNFWDLI